MSNRHRLHHTYAVAVLCFHSTSYQCHKHYYSTQKCHPPWCAFHPSHFSVSLYSTATTSTNQTTRKRKLYHKFAHTSVRYLLIECCWAMSPTEMYIILCSSLHEKRFCRANGENGKKIEEKKTDDDDNDNWRWNKRKRNIEIWFLPSTSDCVSFSHVRLVCQTILN